MTKPAKRRATRDDKVREMTVRILAITLEDDSQEVGLNAATRALAFLLVAYFERNDDAMECLADIMPKVLDEERESLAELEKQHPEIHQLH